MRIFSLSALVLSMTLAAPAAMAQDDMRRETVRFAAGTSGTTIADSITGYGSVAYTLGAEAGQRMTIALEASNGATYFNVYGPGQAPGGESLANSEMTGPMVPDLNRFDAALPQSGEYTVVVYMYRAAARRGERSDYTLDIAIVGERSETVQGDFADGLAGGPDFWRVALSDPTGILNIHDGPSTGAAAIGRLPDGAILRNLGCRMNEGRRWCNIEATAPGGIAGWVAGEFLVESAGDATDGDALVGDTPYNATGFVACWRGADGAEQECTFGVTREGAGTGNGLVMVTWPDGDGRVIYFEAGTPVSYDQSQAEQGVEMTATRSENGVNIIFIGEDRFEIPDAVIWGG
jgi:hypothetical protein